MELLNPRNVSFPVVINHKDILVLVFVVPSQQIKISFKRIQTGNFNPKSVYQGWILVHGRLKYCGQFPTRLCIHLPNLGYDARRFSLLLCSHSANPDGDVQSASRAGRTLAEEIFHLTNEEEISSKGK
ncbi:hypothetical protein C1H46_024092 [Malus baccata]|uniref:Uncharacterized protein n=1 Tax=Malus baccata TaxID=106549 RepID=A0A540LV52_MALBA|nr:hypothetical protein C1H46_024092 [Malus baccata]